MSITPIDTSGATFKFRKKGDANTLKELKCVDGDISVFLGQLDLKEVEQFCGVRYKRGTVKYGDGSMSGLFEEEQLDAGGLKQMFSDSIHKRGIFADGAEMEIEIEFDNSKGTNGTKIEYAIIPTEATLNAKVGDEVSIEVKYKQVSEPVITKAA